MVDFTKLGQTTAITQQNPFLLPTDKHLKDRTSKNIEKKIFFINALCNAKHINLIKHKM